MNTDFEEGVVTPDPAHDYHGHPNYEKILVQLFVLLGVSLAVGYFSSTLSIVIIFGTALWKAIMVVSNFMHLKYEPWLVGLIVAVTIFSIFAFFWGVMPDITLVTREVVPRYN